MENEDILITGGAGSIGSGLVRQLAPKNRVFILDNNETAFFDLHEELNQKGIVVSGKVGDVRDITTFYGLKPSTIFHCAALKHVTPSAWSPEEYVKTNILGTLNVLNFAKEIGARVVNISTDKVINANSVMGATKKVSEIITRDFGQVSVRFGNVMGSRGSVLPIWQRQIDANEPLTVTDDRMERYMMTIPEACALVVKAAEAWRPGKVFILDMGERVNILSLAKEILNKGNLKNEIKIIGMRPGETLDEKLMSAEEFARAEKDGDFWII